jgi:hypothetical protein
MTEADWWAATEPYEWPHSLLHWLFFAGASDRKLRLACVASCQKVEPLAGGAPFPYLLRLIEGFADGKEDSDRVRRAIEPVELWHRDRWQGLNELEGRPTLQEEVELRAQEAILYTGAPYVDREWFVSRKRPYPYPCFVAESMQHAFTWLGQGTVAERTIIHALHDIFGPLPFRDVPVAPAWLTSDVLEVAKGIYEEKAFDRMPILADALQDAGCDNDEMLNHCRAEKWEHVRGCWVIDLILGKPWREQPATA